MVKFGLLSLVLIVGILTLTSAQIFNEEQAKLEVTSNFEGGSVKIIQINQKDHSVTFIPGGNEEKGWPNWWYFQVDGIVPGTEITLVLKNSPIGFWAKPRQATYSEDNQNWHHTNPGMADGDHIIYTQVINSEKAWFAWGPPFVLHQATKMLDNLTQNYKGVKIFNLAKTLEGNPVPALKIAEGPLKRRHRPVIWIQARQHAWEVGSSWVGFGFVEWLLSDDALAVWLKNNTEVIFVPIMDVDNVVSGNGGKDQLPHDHNRDWSKMPHFNAVKQAQKKIISFNRQKRFKLFLDLHNPGKKTQAYFMTPPFELMGSLAKENYNKMATNCFEFIQRPIQFDPHPVEIGPGYSQRWKEMAHYWVFTNTADDVVSLTMEIPWDTPHSTSSGYLTVGQQLGQALGAYMKK